MGSSQFDRSVRRRIRGSKCAETECVPQGRHSPTLIASPAAIAAVVRVITNRERSLRQFADSARRIAFAKKRLPGVLYVCHFDEPYLPTLDGSSNQSICAKWTFETLHRLPESRKTPFARSAGKPPRYLQAERDGNGPLANGWRSVPHVFGNEISCFRAIHDTIKN
jgi:hypothetical protein